MSKEWIILIEGWLDLKNIEQIKEEFRKAVKQHKEIVLVIKSTGGTFNESSIELVEEIRRYTKVTAKIYWAESLAAMIALSTKIRTIHEKGGVKIHDGEISHLSGALVDENGVVPPFVRRMLRKSKEINTSILDICNPGISQDQKSRYQAMGELLLTPQECLIAGLVHEIE